VSAVKASRHGLALVELVVALALAGVVGSAIAVTLTRQQALYRGASELHYARENVRDALEILSSDIRGMSVVDTVRLRADSALEFFATIGSSVVCQTTVGEIDLPADADTEPFLSGFQVVPDSGDLAMVFTHALGAVGLWQRYRITGVATRSLASICPAASAFSSQPEVGAPPTGFVVTLAYPVSEEVKVGAPVRFIRRARYSLYRASDSHWYLGYRRCNAVGASSCGGIQPLSGPYRPYSSDPRASGLLFEYFGATGQQLDPQASPLALARVDITARSESVEQVLLGSRSNRIADSATVSIAVRNHAR
jgi:hypothetical protein